MLGLHELYLWHPSPMLYMWLVATHWSAPPALVLYSIQLQLKLYWPSICKVIHILLTSENHCQSFMQRIRIMEDIRRHCYISLYLRSFPRFPNKSKMKWSFQFSVTMKTRTPLTVSSCAKHSQLQGVKNFQQLLRIIMEVHPFTINFVQGTTHRWKPSQICDVF